MAQDVLIEIGTEELPPVALKTLALAFKEGVENGLNELSLTFTNVQWFATPRRLALVVEQLIEEGPEEAIEVHGPPADRAKDADGNWSKAAAGFAQKNGVDPEQFVGHQPASPR